MRVRRFILYVFFYLYLKQFSSILNSAHACHIDTIVYKTSQMRIIFFIILFGTGRKTLPVSRYCKTGRGRSSKCLLQKNSNKRSQRYNSFACAYGGLININDMQIWWTFNENVVIGSRWVLILICEQWCSPKKNHGYTP